MWGHKRKVRGTSKNFRPAQSAGIVPPTCKLLPMPLSDSTLVSISRPLIFMITEMRKVNKLSQCRTTVRSTEIYRV